MIQTTKNRIEAAMHQSRSGSWQTMKTSKGNHRRKHNFGKNFVWGCVEIPTTLLHS